MTTSSASSTPASISFRAEIDHRSNDNKKNNKKTSHLSQKEGGTFLKYNANAISQKANWNCWTILFIQISYTIKWIEGQDWIAGCSLQEPAKKLLNFNSGRQVELFVLIGMHMMFICLNRLKFVLRSFKVNW